MKNKKLNIIDLFCGCGGLSYGFMKAGHSVILGVDNDEMSLKTFQKNHPGSKGVNINLFDKDAVKKIIKEIKGKKIDLIIGGPPCQGFSLTGTRNFDDKRNGLYLTLLKTVEVIQPRGFLIENVPGMATLYKGSVKDEIIKRCEKMGYNVTCKVLVAADYGVPQIRKRLVFIGLRSEYGKFEFPKPTHTPEKYISCANAISDLPSRENEVGLEIDNYILSAKTDYQREMRENSQKLYNHVAAVHSDKVKKVIALVPEGKNYKSLPKGVGEHRKFHEAWTRYASNRPSKTIDTGHRNHFHYKWNRVPTVRENARLQSFPDTFIFYGSKTQQFRQVGNAVPPLLGFNIAKKISTYIK
jgi:DNA (cytosine-5)-methyltransferase 1